MYSTLSFLGAGMSINVGLGLLAAGIGAGLVLVGAGLAIGKLASSALEGTARQPEAGGAIRTTMIIAAALIEGIALFALVICFLSGKNAMDHGKVEADAGKAPVTMPDRKPINAPRRFRSTP
jgi:F-type H+-transporting ATPase subunit c